MATTITTKGVLTINGKQVEETFNNLRRLTGSLERDLKKLPVGSEEFVKKSEELKIATARFQEVNEQLKETKKSAQQLNLEAKSVGGTFGDMRGQLETSFASLATGEISFKTLGSTIKVFAAQSWAAISSIPLVGWIAAGVAAAAVGLKLLLDFNQQLFEANKLTSQITQLQGDALDKATVRSESIEKALGLDRLDVLQTAKVLVNEYGITYAEALDKIQDGAIRGGSANTEYLKSLKEYPTFFAKAGFSAQEFINIVNTGYDIGIYDDKLPDAIKEFTLSITEQTKTASAALVNAFGADFSKALLDNVSKGKITVKDALVEINQEASKYNLTQKQQAQLTADLFKGAGEDAGGFQKIMEAVTVSIIEQNGELTEIQQTIKDQVDAYDELGVAKVDALKTDSILSLKRESEILWTKFKAWTLDALSSAINGFKLLGLNTSAVFTSIPKYAATAFAGIATDVLNLFSLFGSGKDLIKDVFTFQFDKIDGDLAKIRSKYDNLFKGIKAAGSKIGSDFGVGGNINQNSLDKIYKQQGINAAVQRDLDEKRKKAGANDFDGSATPTKAKRDNAAKQVAADAKKAEAERKKYAEQIEKDDEDAKKQLLANEQQFQASKTDIIEDAYLQEVQKEKDRRTIESAKALTEIAELERKKVETKSQAAKNNYEASIKLVQDTEKNNLEAHQFKLKTIEEKWSEKKFADLVKEEQRKIEESRRWDEDAINDISTMEEAEIALSEMKYLKLTDQELRAIKTLEDAKRALREDADRKSLAAQLAALEQQRIMLQESLKGMTGEAAEKLKADLDVILTKITQIKGAINGGNEADAKKVQEESDAAKDAVDIFGFSAKDWEDTFKNLDTTKDKLKAAGMVFTALSNAGKSFAELQRSLGERDLRRFENIQNKKKTSLLKQLNEGLITQEDYNKNIQKIEAETANKKAEMEYKQAKADKISRMFAIIGNTAMGVSSALAAPFPVNLTLPWIVGAMGAVQLGIAAAQPLPEKPSYAIGGYTGNGFGSADASGFKPAGTVHEGEYVMPKWMVESSRYANVINWLENERIGTANSFAQGGLAESANSSASTSSNTLSGASSAADGSAVLSRVGDFLEYLIVNGVIIAKTAKNGKEADEMIGEWKSLKNKNKH